jgi:hypothetical protein
VSYISVNCVAPSAACFLVACFCIICNCCAFV